MTTMESSGSMFRESGVLSRRSMVESLVLHAILLALLMIVGASVLMHSAPAHEERARHRLLSSSGSSSPGGRGPASGGKGGNYRRTEAKALGSCKRTWETGTAIGSGKGLYRRREAA